MKNKKTFNTKKVIKSVKVTSTLLALALVSFITLNKDKQLDSSNNEKLHENIISYSNGYEEKYISSEINYPEYIEYCKKWKAYKNIYKRDIYKYELDNENYTNEEIFNMTKEELDDNFNFVGETEYSDVTSKEKDEKYLNDVIVISRENIKDEMNILGDEDYIMKILSIATVYALIEYSLVFISRRKNEEIENKENEKVLIK